MLHIKPKSIHSFFVVVFFFKSPPKKPKIEPDRSYALNSVAPEIPGPVTTSGIPLGWSVCGQGNLCTLNFEGAWAACARPPFEVLIGAARATASAASD